MPFVSPATHNDADGQETPNRGLVSTLAAVHACALPTERREKGSTKETASTRTRAALRRPLCWRETTSKSTPASARPDGAPPLTRAHAIVTAMRAPVWPPTVKRAEHKSLLRSEWPDPCVASPWPGLSLASHPGVCPFLGSHPAASYPHATRLQSPPSGRESLAAHVLHRMSNLCHVCNVMRGSDGLGTLHGATDPCAASSRSGISLFDARPARWRTLGTGTTNPRAAMRSTISSIRGRKPKASMMSSTPGWLPLCPGGRER